MEGNTSKIIFRHYEVQEDTISRLAENLLVKTNG